MQMIYLVVVQQCSPTPPTHSHRSSRSKDWWRMTKDRSWSLMCLFCQNCDWTPKQQRSYKKSCVFRSTGTQGSLGYMYYLRLLWKQSSCNIHKSVILSLNRHAKCESLMHYAKLLHKELESSLSLLMGPLQDNLIVTHHFATSWIEIYNGSLWLLDWWELIGILFTIELQHRFKMTAWKLQMPEFCSVSWHHSRNVWSTLMGLHMSNNCSGSEVWEPLSQTLWFPLCFNFHCGHATRIT